MILFDTNILVAAARTADVNHHIAVRLLNTMSEPRLVPPTVVAEVVTSSASGAARTPRSGSCATSGQVACSWPS